MAIRERRTTDDVTLLREAERIYEAWDFFERELEPALRHAGADIVATLASEHARNNFRRVPVREAEEVFVWLSRFADEAADADHSARFDLARAIAPWAVTPPETWRLTPTSRSLLPAS